MQRFLEDKSLTHLSIFSEIYHLANLINIISKTNI
jgi:hypothetical protein